MHIETVIYIYLGVCICMIAMNCIIIFYRAGNQRKIINLSRQMGKQIDTQITCLKENKEPGAQIQKRFNKQLSTLRGLQAFHQAMSIRLAEEPNTARKYLLYSRPIFLRLAMVYDGKENMKRAYFAWIMAQYKISRGIESDAVIEVMQRMIISNSAYCRENALKALYSFGDAQNVYIALKVLDENDIFHHDKLVVDGMMTFEGDKSYLADILWANFDKFSQNMKVTILQYTRTITGIYRKNVLRVLEDEEMGREIRIACIRYLWSNPYSPAAPVLRRELERGEEGDWEVASVAAAALRVYRGQETVEVLKQGLYSPNWYVRFNAADSLNFLNADYQDLASIYQGQDRYAREMLLYHGEQKRIQEEA